YTVSLHDALPIYRIGGVLGHFRIADPHEQGPWAVADKGCIERAHHLSRMLVVGTDDDTVGVHEVVDCSAFLEEFGIRHHRKLDLYTARFKPLADGLAHQIGGAHRHSGLVHDDRRSPQGVANLPG